MAGMDQLIGSPATWNVSADATNAEVTASRAAESTRTHFVTGVEYSFSAVPAAATTAEIRSGATVLKRFRVPATLQPPVVIEFTRPLRCAEGEAASVVVGAGGAAIICSANISGFTTAT